MLDELIRHVEKLLDMKVGDASRLTSIVERLKRGNNLYSNDQIYVDNLISKHLFPQEEKDEKTAFNNKIPLSDDTLTILQNRLAKGEISPEEFGRLKSFLSTGGGLTELKTEIARLRKRIEITEEHLSEGKERKIRKLQAVGGVILLAIGLLMVVGGGAAAIGSMCLGQSYGSCQSNTFGWIIGVVIFWIGMIPTIFGVRGIANA